MSKSCCFIDIDGCVISEDGCVNNEYYQSLSWLAKYILQANVGNCPNIRICSGRNIPFVEAIFYLIGRPDNQWSIIENGSVFFKPASREILVNPAIPQKTLAIFAKIRQKIVPRILKEYPCLWLYPGNIVNITFSKKVESSLDINLIREAIRYMLAYPVKKREIIIKSLKYSISIMPYGVNKGTAVDFLAQNEEINLRSSLGIGDSESDILFLRKMKLIGCPANANEKCRNFVKENRGRVSPFNYAQGVADIIKYFTS